jgi:Schlafen, AlbA_2
MRTRTDLAMNNGQTTLNGLLRALSARPLVLRAVIERKPKPTLRMMVIDALPAPALVGRPVSDYGQAVFIEMAISAERLGRWLKKGRARVEQLVFSVPKSQELVSWRRHPGHTATGPNAVCWPITQYDLYSPETPPTWSDGGFLIADGLPTFMQPQDAIAYYLYAEVRARAQALPSGLGVVRVADTRGYFESIRVGAANLSLSLLGDQVVGARCQLIGGGARQEKVVGKSRRVRIPLVDGLSDDGMLILSAGRDWLDYRYLSRRTQFEDRPDISFDPPDLRTQVALLAHEGEGPTIEYKGVLPTERSHKEHFARTVVAFANTGGGTIIFGIAPDGPEETKLVGLVPFDEPLDHLARIVRDRVIPDPGAQMTACELEGKNVVAVFVPAAAEPFFAVNTTPPQLYVRRGANNFPATLSEIRELAQSAVRNERLRPWNRLA